MSNVRYLFEKGKAYAYANGRVLASAESVEELERKIADLGPSKEPEAPRVEEPVAVSKEPDESQAVYVTTPNGVTGRVLGKRKGLWSDELTVRLDNGRIIHVDVLDGMKYANAKTAGSEKSPVESLGARLAAAVEGDRDGLEARVAELNDIRDRASALIPDSDEADRATLDTIHVQAGYELSEVRDVLAHLDSEDYEGFVPLAPFETHVVPQETMGKAANWLDLVGDEMVKEASEIDYKKLLDEGPTAFVAGLDTAPLADQGVVAEMAMNLVRSSTVAATPDIREPFEREFLARVEDARREELSTRQEKVAQEVKVAAEEQADLPDDSLFL